MNRWRPPEPRQVPEIRADLVDYYASDAALMATAGTINAGRCTIVPTVPELPASIGAVGAPLLTRSEADRLSRASLYYVTADMTALALAAAQTPPTEPVSVHRPPTDAGLMVFADPIGGYEEDAAAALGQIAGFRPGPAPVIVTTPIVAVSWSVWSPDAVRLDSGRVRWLWKGQDGAGVIPDGWHGLWLTFYSARGLGVGLPPETVLGTMPDGMVMRAHHVNGSQHTLGPLLGWDNEMLLRDGARFGEPVPDTTASWAHVVYTAWQLMAQQSTTRWAEVEEVPRARSGAKRDARQGIRDGSMVRVVHVHQAQRPPRQAAEEDASASTGRREPQWSCRWPVRPYRRSTCLNPRAHAEGGCRHEDRIVPGHIKGPADKPLRTGETVHLWDSQPNPTR